MDDKLPSHRPVFTPERLAPLRTYVTAMDVGTALMGAWGELLGDTPFILDSIYLLMAQWALETGRGKACWNYNLGNAKSIEGDNRSFTYYACNEILPSKAARAHAAAAKPRTDAPGPNADITKEDGTTAIIWFYPDHPYARFRAFRTLEDGAYDYLTLLYRRFPKAWPAICQGDPIAFCAMLKAQRYFTADLEPYTKGVASLFREYRKVPLAMPPKPEPEPEPEGLSEEERARTLALLWQTSTELTSKLLEEERILHGQDDEALNDRDKNSTLGCLP